MDAYNASAPGNSGGGFFPPLCVYALIDQPLASVAMDTDSIGAGTLGYPDAFGNLGYAMQSLQNIVPWLFVGRGGTTVQQDVARDQGKFEAAWFANVTDYQILKGRK
jgi:hypothetical protein